MATWVSKASRWRDNEKFISNDFFPSCLRSNFECLHSLSDVFRFPIVHNAAVRMIHVFWNISWVAKIKKWEWNSMSKIATCFSEWFSTVTFHCQRASNSTMNWHWISIQESIIICVEKLNILNRNNVVARSESPIHHAHQCRQQCAIIKLNLGKFFHLSSSLLPPKLTCKCYFFMLVQYKMIVELLSFDEWKIIRFEGRILDVMINVRDVSNCSRDTPKNK